MPVDSDRIVVNNVDDGLVVSTTVIHTPEILTEVDQQDLIISGVSSPDTIVANVVLESPIVASVVVGTPIRNVSKLTGDNINDLSGVNFAFRENNSIILYDSETGLWVSSNIESLIDSDYIQSRQIIGGDGGVTIINSGVDSDTVFSLIDSDYIQSRVTLDGVGIDSASTIDLMGEFSPLVWDSDGENYRIVTGYRENRTKEVKPVRNAEFENYSGSNYRIRLELATFSPVLNNGNGDIILNYNWDQAVSGFSVSVDNPQDFVTQYLNSVSSIETITPNAEVSDINTFATSGPSPLPVGGGSWSQSFTVDANSFVYSNVSDSLSGGQNTCVISFSDNFGSTYETTQLINFNWRDASSSITILPLSGKTFLQSYSNTNYTVATNNISDLSNVSRQVIPIGGSVSNNSGSGVYTFETPIHKNNIPIGPQDISRRIELVVTYNRPSGIGVNGSPYSVTIDRAVGGGPAVYDNVGVNDVQFTYPSFWIFTVGTATPPTVNDIVDVDSYTDSTTTLGNNTRTFAGFVDNTESLPRAFWFGVRSNAAQPTRFQTGAGPSLLSDVSKVESEVELYPNPKPADYINENFKLYGIILQPGVTYVSIGT